MSVPSAEAGGVQGRWDSVSQRYSATGANPGGQGMGTEGLGPGRSWDLASRVLGIGYARFVA